MVYSKIKQKNVFFPVVLNTKFNRKKWGNDFEINKIKLANDYNYKNKSL